MKTLNGSRFITTATIILGSLMFGSTNALAHEQVKVAMDEVDQFDCDSIELHVDDRDFRKMNLEACHEERDQQKIHRFAHEARLEASRYKLSARTNSEIVY